jgi:hypothetical protein
MRHSALTRLAIAKLADAGCDAFNLARIAGHSSITITQRYCHPQADAIERAFAKLTDGGAVVTDGGRRDDRSDNAPKTLTGGEPRRTRTSNPLFGLRNAEYSMFQAVSSFREWQEWAILGVVATSVVTKCTEGGCSFSTLRFLCIQRKTERPLG